MLQTVHKGVVLWSAACSLARPHDVTLKRSQILQKKIGLQCQVTNLYVAKDLIHAEIVRSWCTTSPITQVWTWPYLLMLLPMQITKQFWLYMYHVNISSYPDTAVSGCGIWCRQLGSCEVCRGSPLYPKSSRGYGLGSPLPGWTETTVGIRL